MKEHVSGFKEQGNWVDIVEHGERITAALRDVKCSDEAFDEWDNWRPKIDEQLHGDMREKTTEQAHVEEGPGENADQSPKEDLRNAGRGLADIHNGANELDEMIDEWRESIRYVARAGDSVSRKAIRSFEDAVYMRLMTRLCPLYFDNTLISANLRRHEQRNVADTYILEVNINDNDLKTAVREQLATYEKEYSHWKLETETDTKTVKLAEGIESTNR